MIDCGASPWNGTKTNSGVDDDRASSRVGTRWERTTNSKWHFFF